MNYKTNNLVVVSDLHCGCRVGLCPPRVSLDSAGLYKASAVQKKMWAYWKTFWRDFVPAATGGEPFVAVVNGDAVDGVHHGGKFLISPNIADQIKIAAACLQPVTEAASALFLIRGTETHVGAAAELEEILGHQVGAVRDASGLFSRFELRKTIGPGTGRVVHFAHHISGTTSPASESGAVNRELTNTFIESAQWKKETPVAVIRSHRHRFCHVQIPVRMEGQQPHQTTTGHSLTTPAWQAATPYVHRIARDSSPQFGGVVIRYEKARGVLVIPKVFTLPPIEVN
tara:strand:+ start:1117 stop:1971 length:855 start_codon:yes stop_codon:yes gene_type:complete